jgi:hypothetical protein
MKRLTLLSFFLLPFLFFACQEESNDTSQPQEDLVLSFSNLSNGETVNDSVNVSVDVSPREALSQLTLSFDGEVVDSLESAPFEYGIDTRSVADGIYTLEATATNQSGETTSRNISIEVSNPLAVFEMPVSGGDPGFKSYHYGIHQKDGSLIKGGSIAPGQEIQVEADQPYPSDTVMVTLYYEQPDNSQTLNWLYILTYTQVERGSSWRMNFDEKQPQPSDSIELKVTADNPDGFAASTSLTPVYEQEGDSYTFPARQGTNQYYVTERGKSGSQRYEYGTIQGGNSKTIDILSEEATPKSIQAPGNDISFNLSFAYAYNSDIRKALGVEYFNEPQSAMTFDLPVNEFSNFVIFGYYSLSSGANGLDVVMTSIHQSTVPSEFAFSTGTAQANTNGSSISGTTELGDAQAVIYEANAQSNQTLFNWSVISNRDLSSVSLEIPKVVKNKFPALENVIWESDASLIVKSDAANNYQDFLDIQRKGVYSYPIGTMNIPEDHSVYGSKSNIFNPLISDGSEYVIKHFDTNQNTKKKNKSLPRF